MVDWEGLLKFSLKYSDGTQKSEFKEMPQADKKWLEEAMAQYCNSEIQRIKNILKELETYSKLEEETLVGLLEQLQELLDSLDKGIVLYKLQGHLSLLHIIFFHTQPASRILALQILSSVNQNDAPIQNTSIQAGALQMVEKVTLQKQIKVREAMFGAISAIVRGQNLEAKRIFIRIKGLETIEALLNDKQVNSKRLSDKIFTLLRDLLYYSQFLHLTFHDLTEFSNTASLPLSGPPSHDIHYDKNKEFKENNELQENKKYRGWIQKWLQEKKDISAKYNAWIQQQKKLQEQ